MEVGRVTIPAGEDARPSAMERELVLSSVVDGGPVSVAEVAADTGLRPIRVREALRRLALDDAVVCEGDVWRRGPTPSRRGRRQAWRIGGLPGSS